MILVVDLEEKSTGDFSVSGGYSTTDGALAEVSISERNFLGRGLFAKASVTYGQYARGSRCRSSILICWIIAWRWVSTCSSVRNWPTAISPTAPRRWASVRGLAFALREDLSLQLRYSIYQQSISLPGYLANCNNTHELSRCSCRLIRTAFAPGAQDNGGCRRSGVGLWCYSDGEASLPVRKELASGAR